MVRVVRAGLRVDAGLARFIEDEALPGTGIEPARFWNALLQVVEAFTPRNRALLEERERLQERLDAWHRARAGAPPDPAAGRAFLEGLGYLLPEGPGFTIETEGTDPEIATLSGPQLVAPLTDAGRAIAAANARWGSLLDALEGSDVLGAPAGARRAQALAWAHDFLDRAVPLAEGGWAAAPSSRVEAGALVPRLRDPGQLAGWSGPAAAPERVYLRNNGLLIALASDAAGIRDIELESALTVVMDAGDSVAAVDGADKTRAYRTWLGLMRGTLAEGGGLNGGRRFTTPDGGTVSHRGRALMLVRTAGLLMTTPAVQDREGSEVFEGLLDAMVTVLCALHDRAPAEGPGNSRGGAVYLVKPGLQGPAEVAFTDALLGAVEDGLGLPRHGVRLGLMDEERRTSLNLRECIRAARHRIAVIGTGLSDRIGAEIHGAMEAGALPGPEAMKAAPWLTAYEEHNIATALACGFAGRAQIARGPWAMPGRMAAMLAQKIADPEAGANAGQVPSPLAAVLHATHYHAVDVAARQAALAARAEPSRLDALLALLLAEARDPSAGGGIDGHCLAILGGVAAWVDRGAGCPTVADLDGTGLIENRASLRMASQSLANWLLHEVVSAAEVMDALRRMAAVVDRRNAGDPGYQPIAPRFDGLAFQAACDLIFRGREQPSGCAGPILHRRRRQAKAQEARAG